MTPEKLVKLAKHDTDYDIAHKIVYHFAHMRTSLDVENRELIKAAPLSVLRELDRIVKGSREPVDPYWQSIARCVTFNISRLEAAIESDQQRKPPESP